MGFWEIVWFIMEAIVALVVSVGILTLIGVVVSILFGAVGRLVHLVKY